MKLAIMGLDLAKIAIQMHDPHGHDRVVLKKQVKREQVLTRFGNLVPCHDRHRGLRQQAQLGGQTPDDGPQGEVHDPQFVKPYVKSNNSEHDEGG